MHNDQFPSVEQVRSELAPILSMVARWFETATSRAKASLERDGLPMDGGLFAYQVRAHVKQLLEAATKSSVVDIEGGGLEVSHPAMLGLHFRFSRYCIRAYKTPEGGFPPKGGSIGRRRFFCQLRPMQPSFWDHEGFDAAASRPEKANIAFLWSVDGRGDLADLRMILPNGWDATNLRRVWETHIDLRTALEGDAAAWAIESGASEDDIEISLIEDDLPALEPVVKRLEE